ncbi:MAG: transglycosylase domain-containing protein [Alphaproteobacteria bacterium]|nr:transglycosylase domain-containing protein [Alphaproteobacteria bacterium]
MVEVVWGRLLWRDRRRRGDRNTLQRGIVKLLWWGALLTALFLLGWGLATEARTSYLQSLLLSHWASRMNFAVQPGPSDTVRFPKWGPYDERFGYAKLPSFIEALSARHFSVTHQAQWSPALTHFVDEGWYAVYGEKSRTGLQLFDRDRYPLYWARYPEHTYKGFDSVPPLVADSLLFIEHRDLLDFKNPRRNPAVEWDRFTLAIAGRIAGIVDRRFREGGASTLATQIEKFRHSQGGRTPSIAEKLRQMVTASLSAYRGGPDTRTARREIVTTYLNSTPLGSRPGYGEVIGVPEALWIWYGTDPEEATRVLNTPATTKSQRARKGEIYRQVLSLLLAGRRPTYYLGGDGAAIAALTNSYLRLLADAGVINWQLRDAALAAQLHFRTKLPPPPAVSNIEYKETDRLRNELVSLLHLPDLYALDRLDLAGYGTVDVRAQKRVSDVLTRLGDPEYVRSLGLVGHNLLGGENPGKVTWSFVLYERGADRNYVRIHADSQNGPFDINSGAKLILGSTAKLRTLITYLDIVEQLHRELSPLGRRELNALAAGKQRDPLTAWAAGYLAKAADPSLGAMISAAMHRHYSGSPAAFFTGGGVHVFANFEKWENHSDPTVLEAFEHSINNSFIRIMRDVVLHDIAQSRADTEELLSDPDDPNREAYLRRFADQEGRRYLNRFWNDYRGRTPQEALDQLARRTRPTARRLAVVYLTIRPEASRAELGEFLLRHLPPGSVNDDELWDLWRDYLPGHFTLQQRGYLAGIHPLELWLVHYLQDHSDASRATILEASAGARQDVYAWLFNSHNLRSQNARIRMLLEEDAFNRILQDWRRQGYPFGHLVPSYGTAIGSSGDRPDALADLIGIILNDGVRLPNIDLQRLQFAAGTPYESELTLNPEPERVLAPEVAAAARKALLGVVMEGTAKRLRGTYETADGGMLPVGGKTGTGDNRLDRFGRGGRLISQRVVDRTATFVFFLGDRFFGTVTAYVPGAVAGSYHFTSALAVQLLRALEPQLQPLLNSPITNAPPAAISQELPPAGELRKPAGGEESAD